MNKDDAAYIFSEAMAMLIKEGEGIVVGYKGSLYKIIHAEGIISIEDWEDEDMISELNEENMRVKSGDKIHLHDRDLLMLN